MFPDEAFAFYEGLEADNSKTYWTAHSHIYERAVKEPMRQALEELAPVFKADLKLFRPYRDVRFSKDKSPYKTHQGGFLEILAGVGYYLQLDAEGILVGGGFHSHDPEQTARYRAAVDSDLTGKPLLALTGKLVKGGWELGGDKVKTRPKGVAADHPRLDLMRHFALTAGRRLAPDKLTAAGLRKDWKSLTPLIDWIHDHAYPTVSQG